MAADPKPDNPLNFGFGDLNPIEPPNTAQNYTRSDTKLMPSIIRAVRNDRTPDAITGTGPYKAIVLRVEEEPDTDVGVADWLASMFEGQKSNAPTMVRIKAIVPELHPYPLPEGDGNTDGPHQQDIDHFPTFCAQTDLVPEPAVGDRVWVDFGNKSNFTDPIYLRPILEKEGFTKALGIDKLREQLANAGCGGGGLGVSAPSGDSAGGSNKAVSAHQGPPKGARATSEGEPKVIRGQDATEKWAALWETSMTAGNMPTLSYFSRLPSNGMRDLLVFAPLTTDFSKPVELAYVFHGANGWMKPRWISKEGVFTKVLQEMILDGRNIIFVYPQMPWGGSENASAAGATKELGGIDFLWDDEKGGGNLVSLHGDVLNILNEHFSQDIDIAYLSITAYSKGGEGVHQAASKGQLEDFKPNKITMSDTYGASNEQPPEQVWDAYVSKTQNYVEYNIICEINATSHKKIKVFFKKKLEKEAGSEPLVITGKNHTINYVPMAKDHGVYAAVGVGYVAPAPPAPPEGSTGTVANFGSLASLERVVTFGHSLMGTDVDGNGNYSKAMTSVLTELGGKQFSHYGVMGSNLKQWLGEKSHSDRRPNAKSHNPKLDVNFIAGLDATCYVLSMAENDSQRAKNLSSWIEDCKKLLNTLSPDKTKPIVWMGETYLDKLASEGSDLLYQEMIRTLPSEYPNLLILWPSNDGMKEVYYEWSREVDQTAGLADNKKLQRKLHPPERIHRRHLDTRLGEIKKFFGLDGAKQVPDDNANASPTQEEVDPEAGVEAGPSSVVAEICNKFNRIVELVRLVIADGGFGAETGHNEMALFSKLEELDNHKVYIQTLKKVYKDVEADSPIGSITGNNESLPTFDSAMSHLLTGDSLATATQLLTPKAPDTADQEAEQKREADCQTCAAAEGENSKGASSSDGKSSPSERPGESSTQGSSEGGSSGPGPTKYLDFVKASAERIGVEYEIALALTQLESGKNSFCPNGKLIVRFEPHIFLMGKGNKDAQGRPKERGGLPIELAKQVPWYPCTNTKCQNWTKLGYEHNTRCETNYQVEFEKNMGAGFDLVKKFGAPATEEMVYVAASYGAGQVMGFNKKLLGYSSAKQMYEDFSKSEAAQLGGMFNFLKNARGGKLLNALKAKDFEKIAHYYNGCELPCRVNTNSSNPTGYATKLENEYQKLKSGKLPANRDLIGDPSNLPGAGSTGGGASSQGSSFSGGTAGGNCVGGAGSSTGGGGGGGGGASGGGGTGGPGGTGPLKDFPKVTLEASKQKPDDYSAPEGWDGWYTVFSRTIDQVTHLVYHETAGNGDTLRSARYVRDKGASGLLHHYIDFDGKPWNLVRYDAWGYHGNFLNKVSVGWEAVNPFRAKPTDDKFETYRRIHGTELTRLTNSRLKVWFPPLPWFETQWKLTQKVVKACPNLPMKFVGVRNGGYYPFEGKGRFSEKDMPPPGIIAHAYYYKDRGDGILQTVYSHLRLVGLPPEQAYSETRRRIEDWGTKAKYIDPIDVTKEGNGVENDGLSPPPIEDAAESKSQCPPNTSCPDQAVNTSESDKPEGEVFGPAPPPPPASENIADPDCDPTITSCG